MIRDITVLGAGTMGLGIARFFAGQHYPVRLFEPNDAALQAAEHKLFSANPADHTSADEEDLPIRLSNHLEQAVAGADLVIESAPERLELKRHLFRQLVGMLKADTIVASNTSTFSLEVLAEGQPLADRMIITHFFNPAHLIPLVEIVGLPATSASVIEQIVRFLGKCGKAPVVLRKDVPGFIANRLQAAMMREACYLLEQGIADVDQIDTAVKHGIGLRYAVRGPFEIADHGGLDVWSKVTGHLFPELGAEVETPISMKAKVNSGQLGVKSGSGYYPYSDAALEGTKLHRELVQLLNMKRTGAVDKHDNHGYA